MNTFRLWLLKLIANGNPVWLNMSINVHFPGDIPKKNVPHQGCLHYEDKHMFRDNFKFSYSNKETHCCIIVDEVR